MKRYLMTLLFAAAVFHAAPAQASGGFQEIVNNTQMDFDRVKTNFRAAYSAGYGSWAEYEKATGFSLDNVEQRIIARRARLAMMTRSADTSMDPSTRGLAKMVIKDLDDINLSILALIRDDRGYAGFIRTQDAELTSGISVWQEGIRMALKETGRCVKMVRMVAGQFDAGAELIPVFMH